MNTKLFDEKVVTAQLIELLTDCFNVNVNINSNLNMPSLSLETQLMQEQIKQMVSRIIESDDQFVNDCFFTFTNDEYNDMLQKTEMERIGLHTNDGVNPSTVATPQELFQQLNGLSSNASKEEYNSVIKGSIMNAIASANPHGPGSINTTGNFSVEGINTNFGMNVNILEKLLTNLVYALVQNMLSPKIYIIFMLNLKLMGQHEEFDLSKFMQQFKNMISALIKGVRDEILEFFYNEIMKIIGDLAKTLTVKISLEQYQQYVTLLAHCIDCFKIHRNEYDWAQDAVDYADITDVLENTTKPC